MKVALLAPEFLPNWGGVGTYCIELARALGGQEDLHVVTLERRVDGRRPMSAERMEEYFEGKVHVHVVANANETFLYNGRFQLAVRRYLRGPGKEERFDLLHSNHAHMSHLLYGFQSDRLPIITTVHTTIEGQRRGIRDSRIPFSKLEASERWQVLLHPALRAAETFALGSCDRIITVSRWMREEMEEEGLVPTTPVDIIPNGVDPERFSPARARECDALAGIEKPIVLFTSRLTAAKGIWYAIQAMKEILQVRKDVHFVFAGAGNVDFWHHEFKARGIPEGTCTFLGYVPYDQLPGVYARATVFLLPTLYENLPFRLLEAMSSGAAVVASRLSGIPEAVQHMENGVLIPPGDSRAIVDAVQLLLDDPQRARGLGMAARETVLRKFDWAIIAESTRRLYHDVVEGN